MDEYEENAQDEQAQKAVSDVERSANAAEETAKNTKDLKDSIDNLKDSIGKKGKSGGTDNVHVVEDHDQKEAKEKEQNNVQETASNTAQSVAEQKETNQHLNDFQAGVTNIVQELHDNNDLLKRQLEQAKQADRQGTPKTKTAPKTEEQEEAKSAKPRKPRTKSTPKQEESTPRAKAGARKKKTKEPPKTEETREQKDAKWQEAREHFDKAYGNTNTPAGKVFHDDDFRHGKPIRTARELGLTKEQQTLIKNAVTNQHNLQNLNYSKLLKHQMEGWGFEPHHLIRFVVSGERERDFNPKEYLRSYAGDARSKTYGRHHRTKTLPPIPKQISDEVKLAPKLSGPMRVTSSYTQKEIDEINARKKAERDNELERKKREQKEQAEKRAIERKAEHPVDEKTLEERDKANRPISRTRQALQDAIEKKRLADLKSRIPAQDVLEANARKEADEKWGLDDLTEEQRKKYAEIGEQQKANERRLRKWESNRHKAEQRLEDEYKKQHPAPSIDEIIHDDNIVSPDDFKKFATERMSPYIVIHTRDKKGKITGSYKEKRDHKPTVREIESLHYKNGIIPEEELALKPKEWWDKTYTGSAEQRNIGRKTREQMDQLANLNKAAEAERYKKDEDKFVNHGLEQWEKVHKKPETDLIKIALEIGLDAPEMLKLKKVAAEAKNNESQKVETEVRAKKGEYKNAETPNDFGYAGEDLGSEVPPAEDIKSAKEKAGKAQTEKDEATAYWYSGLAAHRKEKGEEWFKQAENVRDRMALSEARKKYEANMSYFTNGHRGVGGAYHDALMRGLLYRGFRVLEWRAGLLRSTAGRIAGDAANDKLLRKMLGYKEQPVTVDKMVPQMDEKGQVVKDAEGNVQYVPQMVQARDKHGNPIFNEDGSKKMVKATQTELISNKEVTKGQQRLRNLLGFHPQVDPRTGNFIVPSQAGITSSLIADKAIFAGAIKKVGMVALPLLLATAVAGAGTAEIRDVRNRTINNGTTAGQAFGNTVQDALFDVGHMFGFSANSGKDIREDRQEALQQNYKLFGQKADNLVSTNMWATSMGFTTQQDKNWIEEQVAMGKSAEQVRNSFLNLTKVANSTGVSFKNLSEAVATEETNATKLLGSKYTGGLVKGTAGALEDLKKAGLNGTQQTLNDLAGDKQFQLALTRELNAKGYAKQASELAATPQLLMQFALSHGVFKGALSNFSRMYYNAAGGQQLAYEAMLVKTGLKASDVQSSLQTMYNQTKKNVKSNSSSNSNSKKQVANSPQVLEIRLREGMIGKVIAGGKYQQGLHDVTGTGQYFSMKNFTTGTENE